MLGFSELQRDAITEVLNIAIGRAAAALNQMVDDEEVRLSVPCLDFLSRSEATLRLRRETGGAPTVAVKQRFAGPEAGDILLIFPESRSLELVHLMLRNTTPLETMTEMEREALVEVGNVLLNACLGSIANLFRRPIDSSLPVYVEAGGDAILHLGEDAGRTARSEDTVMFVHVEFALAQRDLRGYLACVMDIASAQAFGQHIEDYVRQAIGN